MGHNTIYTHQSKSYLNKKLCVCVCTMLNLSEFRMPPGDVWIEPGIVPPAIHMTSAVYLFAVTAIGAVSNTIVLYVFLRYLKSKTQETMFIANMAFSDLVTSLLQIMSARSSLYGEWIYSSLACELYAATMGLCGLVSIVTLAAISVERCLVISRGRYVMTPPYFPNKKNTLMIVLLLVVSSFSAILQKCSLAANLRGISSAIRSGRQLSTVLHTSTAICVCVWMYSAALVVPPFFNISAYIPEGYLTSCSWDYFSQTATNRAYYITLLTFGFIVPVSAIFVSYLNIYNRVRQHVRSTIVVGVNRNLKTCYLRRLARMLFLLTTLFVITWLPYAVVTMLVQFGAFKRVPQWLTALPAMFAKSSGIFNSAVYGLTHKRFRQVVIWIMSNNIKLIRSNYASSRAMVPAGRITSLQEFPHRVISVRHKVLWRQNSI